MANLSQGWINHLRKQAKSDQAATANFKETTPSSPKHEAHDEISHETAADVGPQLPSGANSGPGVPAEDDAPARKKLRSPTHSVDAGDRKRSPSPTRRSKARQQVPAEDTTSDFPARPVTKNKGRLWHDGDPMLPRSGTAQPSTQLGARPPRRHNPNKPASQTVEEEDPSVTHMIKQPDTRPISQEQLVAEVKGIYAGLVMVESKCIEVDSAQNAQKESSPKLNNEQWQAIISLHRTLLHEHHDFFLASQHPSASPALRRLAIKYAMPARM